jgi:hypothetical protein
VFLTLFLSRPCDLSLRLVQQKFLEAKNACEAQLGDDPAGLQRDCGDQGLGSRREFGENGGQNRKC